MNFINQVNVMTKFNSFLFLLLVFLIGLHIIMYILV